MKKKILILTIFLTTFAFAGPWMDAGFTGYEGKGPSGFFLGTMYGDGMSNILANAPFGGYNTAYTNYAYIFISNAVDGVCKIRPKDKAGQAEPLALFIVGSMPKTVIVEGGKSNESELLYVYADGNLKKLIIKGFEKIGKIAINNNDEGKGVTIQNAFKPVGNETAGNVHSVIVSGKLKKLQSKKGGFGGSSSNHIGAIAIEGASQKGIIKSGPKAEMSFLLFCGGLVNGGYNYAEAYDECWASQKVDNTVVKIGSIKKVDTKVIGPAVFGLQVVKKLKNDSKLTVTNLIGEENLVESN